MIQAAGHRCAAQTQTQTQTQTRSYTHKHIKHNTRHTHAHIKHIKHTITRITNTYTHMQTYTRIHILSICTRICIAVSVYLGTRTCACIKHHPHTFAQHDIVDTKDIAWLTKNGAREGFLQALVD